MGVEKTIVKPATGTGPVVEAGQLVYVHFTGYGKNSDLSQKFWSTKESGHGPLFFRAGRGGNLKGLAEGVLGMQVGEVARLKCSPDYAFGAGSFASLGIAASSDVVFEIELIKIG